jgi:hypothetical protein
MAVAVVGLLVALVVQGGGGGASGRSLLADAPAKVERARTAQLRMSVKVGARGMAADAEGHGAVDFTSSAGSFDLDVLGQHVAMRTDGTTLYVLPDGQTTWLAIGADQMGALGPVGTGPAVAIALVDALRGDVGEVDDLGTEKIGGAKVRHLRAHVQPSSIQGVAPLVTRGQRVPLDVWVDHDGRPIRERLRGTLQGIDLVVTVDLTRFGSKLGVSIPPEGEIRTVEPQELEQLLGRQNP